MRRSLISLAGAAVVISADQLQKSMASEVMLNPGVSFGIGANWPALPVFTWLLVVALGLWLLSQAWKFNWSWWGWLGIGLTIGGGVSNLLDRWLFMGVRDTMMIPGTAIYNNLADYCIFVGLLIIILCFATGEHQQED